MMAAEAAGEDRAVRPIAGKQLQQSPVQEKDPKRPNE